MSYTDTDRIKAKNNIKNLEWVDAIGLEALGLERKGSLFCPKFEANGITIEISGYTMGIMDVTLPDGKHLHEMFDIYIMDDGDYCYHPEAAKYLYERIGLINPDD